MLTYWLNIQLTGLSMPGLRIGNLLLHLLCGLLFGVLVRRVLAGSHRPAADGWAPGVVATAVFVLHPVFGEAVNLVLKRNTSLCALLMMLALLALDATRRPGARARVWWSITLAFGGAAMFVKETAVVMPALVALYGARRGMWQGAPARLATSVGLFAVVPLLYVVLWFPVDTVPPAWAPRLTYLLAQPAALADYALLLLVPSRVAIAGGVDPGGWPPGLWSSLGAGVVLGLLLAILLLRRRAPTLFFAVAWAGCCLAPSSTVIPLKLASDPIRLYLAALGFLALGAQGLVWLGRRLGALLRRGEIATGPAIAVITALPTLLVCLYIFVSALGNNDRRGDALTAWRHAIAVYPESRVANGNICATLFHQGSPAAARRACRRALSLDPNDPWVNTAVVMLHHREGRRHAAERALDAAKQRVGATWQLSLAEGFLAWSAGDCPRAERAYSAVLRLYPGNTRVRLHLADCLLRRGKPGVGALLAPLRQRRLPDAADRRLLQDLSRRLKNDHLGR
jgi:tetratricopeptide (TPR) repeat protein